MDDHAAKEVWAFRSRSEHDCSSEGAAYHMGWSMADVFQQTGEIRDILTNTALSQRTLAPAVPAPVVGEDPERL
jgi:hypothetical protein